MFDINTHLDFLICNEPQVQDVCQRGRVDQRFLLESHTKRCKWLWIEFFRVLIASQSKECKDCWDSSHHISACN